ncbi:MAG: hypothetical protein WC451_06420 [Patescibacteria group bacterium]|jgi:hypothetical protein
MSDLLKQLKKAQRARFTSQINHLKRTVSFWMNAENEAQTQNNINVRSRLVSHHRKERKKAQYKLSMVEQELADFDKDNT